MRIELVDDNCYSHMIDSTDLELIGRWFAEKAPLFMSANTRVNHPARLHIWPSSYDEGQLIPTYHRERKLTCDSILALAEHLTNISADWPAEVPV